MGFTEWLKNILGLTFRLNDDDMVVFVVGPSGSGKSMFVQAVTQTENIIEVGQTLRPFTRDVQAIRCELSEKARTALGTRGRKNIVFVDTPSFHTAEDNNRAEKKTSTWLKNARSKSTSVGTIYMHRVEIDPNDGSSVPQMHLDTFAHAFPRDSIPDTFPCTLHCVFSCVDKVGEQKKRDHMKNFGSQLSALKSRQIHGWTLRWNVSTHPRLFINGDPATAWEAVEALFSLVQDATGGHQS